MSNTLNFELVVPAYNEENNLQLLLEKTIAAAKEFGLTEQNFNLVVVNNGSTDNSREVLENLLNSDLGQWFRVVTVEINQGYGHGIWSGLKSCHANIVGWSHADLQCDPGNAFKAYEILNSANNNKLLVKGHRTGRDGKDVFVSRVFEMVAKILLGLKTSEVNAQPKVFHRSLLDLVTQPPKTFAFDLYVLYCAQKNNYSFKEIQVNFPPRIHGTSKWASTFLNRYKTIWGMIVYIWNLQKSEGRL